MILDITHAQQVSAALFIVTAALLLYATRRASSRRTRVAAWLSILTSLGAINFMMLAYAGEPEFDLQRPGPIQRAASTFERGYFEFVDRGASNGGSARGRHGTTRLASLAGADDGVDTQPVRVRDCDDCPELVIVEPGYVRIGAAADDADATASERPARVVGLANIYAIGRFELTVGQFQTYLAATGQRMPPCSTPRDLSDARLPMTCVSFQDAQGYVRWLSGKTRLEFRLPSEAEWEYAARAGSSARFVGGNVLAADAANVGHRDARLLPVGSFTANGFGLYDVNGNAAELAADCWRDSPAALPGDARPARAGWTCPQRALRDGSAAEPVAAVRLSARRPIAPDARMAGVGFRVMREVR